MKFDGIIVSAVYNHFYKMKEKGRNVVPWFQTVFVLSLALTITITLIVKICLDYFNKGYYQLDIKEPFFLLAFIFSGGIFFFMFKKIYFNSGKHLTLIEEFQGLPKKKRNTFNVVVLLILIMLPILLYLVIVFNAFKYQP